MSIKVKGFVVVVVVVAAILFAPNAVCQQQKQLDVPYEATPLNIVEAMLELASVSKDDIVYDLGCGDGRIVITAAKKYGARGVGVDIDPERIREANANAIKAGVADLVRFIQQDLFEAEIKEATVVTLYLLPEINLRLRPKLFRELKPGTRVVSERFDMGDWKPDKTVEVRFQAAVPARYQPAYGVRKINYWVIPDRVKSP
jgi:SAM-dependent methyltransferase